MLPFADVDVSLFSSGFFPKVKLPPPKGLDAAGVPPPLNRPPVTPLLAFPVLAPKSVGVEAPDPELEPNVNGF